jgi:hypothetical protein
MPEMGIKKSWGRGNADERDREKSRKSVKKFYRLKPG